MDPESHLFSVEPRFGASLTAYRNRYLFLFGGAG